jgi:hypothetical protein
MNKKLESYEKTFGTLDECDGSEEKLSLKVSNLKKENELLTLKLTTSKMVRLCSIRMTT